MTIQKYNLLNYQNISVLTYLNYCEKITITKVHKRTVLLKDMFYGCVLGESDHAEFVHQVDRPSF